MRGIHGVGNPFRCDCGAKFKSRTSLWRHKKTHKLGEAKTIGPNNVKDHDLGPNKGTESNIQPEDYYTNEESNDECI